MIEDNPQLTIKQPWWKRLGSWIKKHPKTSYIIGGTILIVIASAITFALLYQKPVSQVISTVVSPKKEKPAPVHFYSPLTGKEVKNEAATKQAVTAIMIENSPDARPQSGLKEAGVVYEAIAEGGITRFLALYQQEKPQLIGPVRSLRMYYVDWLTPYNASVAHVGGSAAALAKVRNGAYRDIDQFFNAGYYWRATDRYAPHNVYTSFEKLDELNKAKGYTTSQFTGIRRGNSKASKEPNATKVTINISGPAYNTHYVYNKKTNSYDRFLAGAPHIDREKGQISPKVVVALRVDEERVLEDGYRESIKTIGKGKAVVFQNGEAKNVTWEKRGEKSQLSFTRQGKPFPLARGQTWITAVPNSDGGDVSWQ